MHDFAAKITGSAVRPQQAPRYGLLRAEGSLEHPIMLGTACMIAIMLGMAQRGTARALIMGGAAIALLASISSGPMMATVIGLGCVAYRHITKSLKLRWTYLALSVLALVSPIFVFKSSPLGWVLNHFTLDQDSAFYRLIIWDVAGHLVLESPIFGVGSSENWQRPEWMPATVDSFWLRSAMTFGIPGAVMIAGCLISACAQPTDRASSRLSSAERELAMLLACILWLYIFLGFTVHFWGVAFALIGFLAGMRAQLGALANRQNAAV